MEGGNLQLSDDDSTSPAIPRHVHRQRGGWAGDALELERPAPSKDEATQFAAVDLTQFRNTQVGKGYQAKHVIRQRSANEPSRSMQDMTKDSRSHEFSGKGGKLRKAERSPEGNTRKKSRLHTYLQCEGLRLFRKELETIESSIRKV